MVKTFAAAMIDWIHESSGWLGVVHFAAANLLLEANTHLKSLLSEELRERETYFEIRGQK